MEHLANIAISRYLKALGLKKQIVVAVIVYFKISAVAFVIFIYLFISESISK